MLQTLTLDRRLTLCLGALLAPVAAVMFVGFSDGAGPRSSQASVANPPAAVSVPLPPATIVAINEPSPSLTAFVEHQHAAIVGLASPMVQRPAPVATPMSPAIVVQPEAAPALDVPSLRLTGVMTSANRRYASINHNLYKEGDEVQPGWSVRSIDGTTRRVVVEHTSGATIELFAE